MALYPQLRTVTQLKNGKNRAYLIQVNQTVYFHNDANLPKECQQYYHKRPLRVTKAQWNEWNNILEKWRSNNGVNADPEKACENLGGER